MMTMERFLGFFYKLSSVIFAQANQIAAVRFSCDIISHDCTRSAVLKHQNVALRFYGGGGGGGEGTRGGVNVRVQ
jgi:hypothetical protein